MTGKPRHLESAAQRLFIARCRLDPRTRDLPIFAIPNGGRRGKIEAGVLKGEGVLAGVPDIFVAVPFVAVGPHHGLFLEFKTPTGRVSPAQARMIQTLINQGYDCAVVRSETDAWAVLSEYLGITAS